MKAFASVGNASSHYQLCTLVDGKVHSPLHLFQLSSADERPHVQRVVQEGIPILRRAHFAGDLIDEFVERRPFNIDAFRAITNLPGIDDAGLVNCRRGQLQIRGRKHDGGRFASQLKINASQVGRCGAHDALARLHVDIRRPGKPSTGFPSPGDQVEYPWGQARFSNDFSEREGIKRCFFAWLDDDGVAGDERRRHLSCDQKERKIPRQDAGDNADGLAHQQDSFIAAIARKDFALYPPGPFGHVVKIVGGERHLDGCQPLNLALLLAVDLGQLARLASDAGCDRLQVARALNRGPLLPAWLRSASRPDGIVNVLVR